MGTTERWIDQQIKERNRRLLRKHWWRLGLMGFVILCFGPATWLVAPNLQVPLWSVIPATCYAVLAGYWDQLAGTANLASGRDAEGWTSKELRKVCGPAWHVIDGISFAFHDVDHVLVGPAGIYAVETKYTDSTIDLDTRRGREFATQWADQAAEGGRSIRSLLLHNFGVLEVYPGVIVWGREVSGSPHFVDGIPILRPKDLAEPSMPWRRDVPVLSTRKIDAIVRVLCDYRDERIRYERRDRRSDAA